ncbi:flagellar hook-length control protein FliK [Cellulomonas cellasea]|uniref:flagellar hook-length control protein FliK n=1 Tax=Cellulomonas cellasea TaxID=43670 RepID=UPI0025A3F279|nr:flagellar hook-length control protein FliK [Cellulomonas cellasea]MDM8083386.1 flagellar hook-length control protein FliK [Cellulomonas cellasea]
MTSPVQSSGVPAPASPARPSSSPSTSQRDFDAVLRDQVGRDAQARAQDSARAQRDRQVDDRLRARQAAAPGAPATGASGTDAADASGEPAVEGTLPSATADTGAEAPAVLLAAPLVAPVATQSLTAVGAPVDQSAALAATATTAPAATDATADAAPAVVRAEPSPVPATAPSALSATALPGEGDATPVPQSALTAQPAVAGLASVAAVTDPAVQAVPRAAAQAPVAVSAATAGAQPVAGAAPVEAATPAPASAVAPPAADPLPVAVPVVAESTPLSATRAVAPVAPAPPPPVAAQLAPQLASVRSLGEGQHVMSLAIDPEHLGPVRVVAHISPDAIRIELIGATDASREALRSSISELRRDLAASGLQAELELGQRQAGSADDQRSGDGAQRRAADPAGPSGIGQAAGLPAQPRTPSATRPGGIDVIA